jgi:formate dehydrogenase major subunit
MLDDRSRGVSKGEEADSSRRAENGDVLYSEDPRDIGWVRENIPCQTACPAGTNVPAYIQAIIERQHGTSYEINREANVLPGVLGRICSRPCEDVCRHGWPGNGAPVDICHLKRAASDLKSAGHRITESLYTPSGKTVAIVGAGPAGVAAAHDLSLLGHDVTIFERESKPGGMLYYGIPAFRLPREILKVELHNALRLGVELKTGLAVGNGHGEIAVSGLLGNFDAVLLSTGCMAAVPLPLRGDHEIDPVLAIPNVEYGLDFLLELHRGETKQVGERVAVVGAGFTALDCARVARRLGAKKITIHLRTTEEYIPVTKDEIFEVKREDVKIRGLRSPAALVTGDAGNLAGVQFVQNRLGGWRESGRRHAIPIERSEFVEPCDTLLVAIGQKTVTDYLDVEAELDRWGNVRVGEAGMTSVEGLFAAGDHVNGVSTVIEAVGHGRAVALGIDTWLMGRVRRKAVVRIEPVDGPLRERAFDFIPRQEMPTSALSQRCRNLDIEVEKGMGDKRSLEEAKRCYLCNLKYEIDIDNCIYCRACIEVAPKNCIKLVEDVEIKQDGTYGGLKQTNQWNRVGAIWIDSNECIRCGACFMVCPTRCISITRNELVTRDV